MSEVYQCLGKKFSCKVSLLNASFNDNPSQLADILRVIADQIDGMGTEKNGGLLVDDNGNSVGKWGIK